ncbi:conserved hypothetical protein [Luteimonas sp. 9C]|uniref:hypothetical protein n=1 Tax=Luteimonas sp. 9C TaxID=2653148 RepID=UPI0012F160FA|nr:hypothetical protein [Luteimonas sp. 9C]VXB54682.1 conserved hypothetical protein [Luteimonas sp. 9C]
MRYDRDAVSPWAFFLPVALAVMVGSLVADAIGGMLRDRFDPTPAPMVEQAAVPVDAAPVDTAAPMAQAPAGSAPVASPGPAIDAPDPDTAPPVTPDVAGAPLETAMPVDDGTRRLSGPMTARQAGESESCINNTVATRSPNGWEQALENDAPVRCEATSN